MNADPMLTVLHGFTETDQVWRKALGQRPNLRCELLPGHGWKPFPPGLGAPELASDLAQRLPNGPSDLLGYSMGGRLALHLALAFPQRIRRLILISCHAGIVEPEVREKRRKRDEALAQILEEDGIGPFVAWWESNPSLRPAKPQERKAEEDMRCIRLNQEPRGLAAALRQAGQGVVAPLWDRLGELRMPVLLVAGAADQTYSRRMAEMAGAIPGSRLELVPDSGHAVHREQPVPLATLLDAFLK